MTGYIGSLFVMTYWNAFRFNLCDKKSPISIITQRY